MRQRSKAAMLMRWNEGVCAGLKRDGEDGDEA
jgi:hypothetical protein